MSEGAEGVIDPRVRLLRVPGEDVVVGLLAARAVRWSVSNYQLSLIVCLMALLYGGDWDDEFVLNVHNSRESSETLNCEIEPLLGYYPDISKVDFTNIVSFKMMCCDLYDGLVEGRGCPYLAFLGVSPGMFEAIDRLREKRSCPIPQMSVLYDKVEEILITKFRVGVAHDTCGRYFEQRLLEMFGPRLLIGSLASTGSGRRGTMIRRSKEPDLCFIPTSRDVIFDWPSVVVEVGDSESLSCLQGDLSYWLRNMNGTTRVAILLHINKTNGTILIERWEAIRHVRSARANVNYGPLVRRAQSILLDARVVYNGESLSIPADQVFDTVPANVGPGQFTLTARDLDLFNNQYWATSNMVPRRYF